MLTHVILLGNWRGGDLGVHLGMSRLPVVNYDTIAMASTKRSEKVGARSGPKNVLRHFMIGVVNYINSGSARDAKCRRCH